MRTEPKIKAVPQAVAQAELRSVATMIDVMVVAYCKTHVIAVEAFLMMICRTASLKK